MSVRKLRMIDQNYKGFKLVKMDPKARVSIQPTWRPEHGESLFLQLSREYDLPVVRVLTRAAYAEKVQVINDSEKTPAEKRRLRGKLATYCLEAGLNEQGKLLVPRDFCEKAELGASSEAAMLGRGDHFIICTKDNFDKLHSIEAGYEEDDDLGIF